MTNNLNWFWIFMCVIVIAGFAADDKSCKPQKPVHHITCADTPNDFTCGVKP